MSRNTGTTQPAPTIKDKLRKLAELRGADSLYVYFTSDKSPGQFFSSQIAGDVLDIYYSKLRAEGKKNKISILLHTSGGRIEAPWPLISLFREYCVTLEVIVCHKALSAGTLICLGADKIIMSPGSYLSPIDPSGSYVVGNQKKEIEIENISSFIRFAKERIGASEQSSLVEVMRLLVNEVPPSILGSVYRTHFMIRSLAEKMLRSHKNKIDEQQINTIIKYLTENLYAHNHLISRTEAKDIVGFKNLIKYAVSDEESIIEDIYKHYAEELELNKSFNLEEFAHGMTIGQQKEFETIRGAIETKDEKQLFKSKFIVTLNPPGAGPQFNVNEVKSGWETI